MRIAPDLSLQHGLPQDFPRAEHRRRDIDGHRGVPVLQRLLPDPSVLPGDGCVVAENVDAARTRDGTGHHGGDVVLVGHVGSHGNRPPAGIGGGLPDEVLPACREQHPGTLSNEHGGHHRSQPGARPRDDRHLAVQSSCHSAASPKVSLFCCSAIGSLMTDPYDRVSGGAAAGRCRDQSNGTSVWNGAARRPSRAPDAHRPRTASANRSAVTTGSSSR